MSVIHVFIDKDSNNGKLFYGKSTSEMTYDAKITSYEAKTADELISYALKTAPKDSYILCAFGPLLTTLNAKSIYDVLEFVIGRINFDVFYLTRYADVCEYKTDTYSYENLEIMRTISPYGTECILISPNGAEKVKTMFDTSHGRSLDYYLNAKGENMLLYSSFPPLITVDVSKRTKDIQLVKTTVCREKINLEKPIEVIKRYNGNMNIFWFFLIIIFVLFIAIMLISFSDTSTTSNVPNKKPLGVPVGLQDVTGSFTT